MDLWFRSSGESSKCRILSCQRHTPCDTCLHLCPGVYEYMIYGNAVFNIHIQKQKGHRELKWTSNMVQNQWAQWEIADRTQSRSGAGPTVAMVFSNVSKNNWSLFAYSAGFPAFFQISGCVMFFHLVVVKWLSLSLLTNWGV